MTQKIHPPNKTIFFFFWFEWDNLQQWVIGKMTPILPTSFVIFPDVPFLIFFFKKMCIKFVRCGLDHERKRIIKKRKK